MTNYTCDLFVLPIRLAHPHLSSTKASTQWSGYSPDTWWMNGGDSPIAAQVHRVEWRWQRATG